jgi:hypothetical protein
MVFIKKVANADAGDADHVGGDNWDTLDDFLADVNQDASRTGLINTKTRFRDTKLQIRNPANTFNYSIRSSAIIADRDVTLPLLTAAGNFAIDSFPNIFTTFQQVQLDAQDLFLLYRPSNVVGSGGRFGIRFDCQDSAAAKVSGATYLISQLVDNTAGSVDSLFSIWTRINSVATEVFRISGGIASIGATLRISLSETGLTATRIFTFPDVTTALAGLAVPNQTFTENQLIKKDTQNPLDLYRPTSTLTSKNYLNYSYNNNSAAQFAAGTVGYDLVANGAGIESTDFYIANRSAGTPITPFAIDNTGVLYCGGPNRRVKFNESGLTAQRSFTFPDINAKMAGVDIAQTFTAVNKFDTDIRVKPVTGLATDGTYGQFYSDADNLNEPRYKNTDGRVMELTMGQYTWRKRPAYFTDCLGSATANIAPFNLTNLSSGTTSSVAATDGNHIGIQKFISSTTANSGDMIATANNAMLLAGGEIFEAYVKFSSFTNNTVRIGLHDANTSVAPVDGVYFEHTGTSTVSAKTMSNSVGTTAGTTFTATAGVWYRFRIDMTTSARADFFIYDESATQLYTNNITTNIPTGASRNVGSTVIGTNSTTTGAIDICEVDYVATFPGGLSDLSR